MATQTVFSIDVNKSIADIKMLNSNIDKLNVSVDKTEKSLKELSKVNLGNKLLADVKSIASEINKTNKTIQTTTSGLKSINNGLTNISKVNISKSISEFDKKVLTARTKVTTLKTSVKDISNITMKDVTKDLSAGLTSSNTKTKTLKKNLDVLDDVSLKPVSKKLEESLDSTKTKAQKLKQELTGIDSSTNSYSGSMVQAEKTTGLFGDTISRAGVSMLAMQSIFQDLSSLVTGAVQQFQELDAIVRETSYQFTNGDFSTGFSNVRNISDNVTAGFEQLQTMAHLTSFTTIEMADAMLEVSKAGFEFDSSMGIVSNAMIAADMNGLSLKDTVHTVTGTLQAFGESLKTADNPTEVFNQRLSQMQLVADLTQSDLSDLTQGMTYLAPIAENVGMSFEDASVMLALLGDAGLEASKGARVLSSGMLNITAPTKDASQALEEVGFSAYDQAGNLKGLIPIITDLQRATADMTEEQRAMFLSTVFGKTAIKSWGSILNIPISQYSKLTDEINKTSNGLSYVEEKFLKTTLAMDDTAIAKWNAQLETTSSETERIALKQEMFNEAMVGLAERNPAKFFEQLTDSLTDFKTELGASIAQLTAVPLSGMIDKINNLGKSLFNAFGKTGETIDEFIKRIVAVGVASLGVVSGVSILSNMFRILSGAIIPTLAVGGLVVLFQELDISSADLAMILSSLWKSFQQIGAIGGELVKILAILLNTTVIPLVTGFAKLNDSMGGTLGTMLLVGAGVFKMMKAWQAYTAVQVTATVAMNGMVGTLFASQMIFNPWIAGIGALIVVLSALAWAFNDASKASQTLAQSEQMDLTEQFKKGEISLQDYSDKSAEIARKREDEIYKAIEDRVSKEKDLLRSEQEYKDSLDEGTLLEYQGLLKGQTNELRLKLKNDEISQEDYFKEVESLQTQTKSRIDKTYREQAMNLRAMLTDNIIEYSDYQTQMKELDETRDVALKNMHESQTEFLQEQLDARQISEEEFSVKSKIYRNSDHENFMATYATEAETLKATYENGGSSFETYSNKIKELLGKQSEEFEIHYKNRKDELDKALANGQIEEWQYQQAIRTLEEDTTAVKEHEYATRREALDTELGAMLISEETHRREVAKLDAERNQGLIDKVNEDLAEVNKAIEEAGGNATQEQTDKLAELYAERKSLQIDALEQEKAVIEASLMSEDMKAQKTAEINDKILELQEGSNKEKYLGYRTYYGKISELEDGRLEEFMKSSEMERKNNKEQFDTDMAELEERKTALARLVGWYAYNYGKDSAEYKKAVEDKKAFDIEYDDEKKKLLADNYELTSSMIIDELQLLEEQKDRKIINDEEYKIKSEALSTEINTLKNSLTEDEKTKAMKASDDKLAKEVENNNIITENVQKTEDKKRDESDKTKNAVVDNSNSIAKNAEIDTNKVDSLWETMFKNIKDNATNGLGSVKGSLMGVLDLISEISTSDAVSAGISSATSSALNGISKTTAKTLDNNLRLTETMGTDRYVTSNSVVTKSYDQRKTVDARQINVNMGNISSSRTRQEILKSLT